MSDRQGRSGLLSWPDWAVPPFTCVGSLAR